MGITDLFLKLIQDSITFCYDLSAVVGFPNYGFAIILFTALLKVLLFPLTAKQIKSAKAMQEMQPRLKEVQERYKHDKAKQQEEIMKLYKETGFNPLAGCLPLLVQMPLLMGIFFALKDYDYGPIPPAFLWVADLAQPDSLYILPVISALATFAQTRQTITDTTTTQNMVMLYFMPVFIGYISLQFPAGLVLYWIVNSVLQIVQHAWHSHLEKRAGSSEPALPTVEQEEDQADIPSAKVEKQEGRGKPTGKRRK